MSRRIISLPLALFLIRASIATAAPPTAIEGDWIGGFDGQDGAVFIAARFTPEGETLRGEVDLPLRGDHKVPLAHVAASDSKLSFEIPGAHGNLRFEGRRQNSVISGSVRQMRSSSRFELFKVTPVSDAMLNEIAGDYELEPGRVILVARSPQGALYLDHTGGRMGLLYAIGERTFVSGPSLVAGYPVELTVTFDRAEHGGVPAMTWEARGQPARRAVRKTYYTTEPIRVPSGDANLGASLLLPVGPGPHPAVVMIHGSGPVTRDVLLPYADVFARNGIAVLIHDKRGTGTSTGNWARATFDDLAGDALAGVAYLKRHPEINARQIGLQGSSLGGWVAPLAASRSADVAFVIVESAPALSPIEHERLRVRSQLRADGFGPMEVAHALQFMDQKFDVARTGQGWDRLQEAAGRAAQAGWLAYVNPPTSLESLQWHWANVLSYDPVPALERLTCPVLVLYGGLDTIVPASENRKRMERAFARGGLRDVTIKVFDQANHGFFAAITGGKREAGGLKGLVPGYLDTRVDWLRQRVNVSVASSAPAGTPPPPATTVAPETSSGDQPASAGGPRFEPVPGF